MNTFVSILALVHVSKLLEHNIVDRPNDYVCRKPII